MPTDLWDLSTRLTVDTTAHDAALKKSQTVVHAVAGEHEKAESSAKKFSDGLRVVASSAVVAEGPLGGVSSRLRALGTEVSELGALGPGGAFVAGLLAIATASVVAADGLFELAKHTAEYIEKMDKASLSTGLSQRALGGLKVISDETSSSFEGLTTTAARMQTAISRGISEPASEAGRALKFMGLQNEAFKQSAPDKQLQMVAKAISEITNQADKNRASQALMNRGWIESAESIHRIAEGLDEAEKKADEFGLVMTERDIKAAQEFNVAIHDLWLRFEGFGLAVGRQILPQVEAAIKDVTNAIFGVDGALGKDQSAWASWADFAVKAVMSVRVEASALASFIRNLPLVYAGPAGLIEMGRRAWNAANAKGAQVVDQYFASQQNTGGDLSLGAGITRQRAFPGGGRGGGGRAHTEIDQVTQALSKQREEINDAILGHDKYAKEIDRVVDALAKKKKALTDSQMAQLLDNAETLRGIEADKNYREFMQKLSEQLYDATHVTDEWDKMLRETEKQLAKNHKSLSDFVGAEQVDLITKLRLIDALKKEAEAMQELNITRLRYAEVTKSTRPRFLNIPESGDPRNDTRSRIATDAEELNRAIFQGQFDKMRQLAESLTGIINDSIHQGFRDGMKAGLAEFALGILQMIESKVLMKLTDSITDALMKGFSNTGGGSTGGGGFFGFLKTILPFIGSAVGGASGGTKGMFPGLKGGLKGFASGLDYVPYDNFPAMLHKGERVLTAQQAQQGGAMTVNFYVQHPSQLGSRETQRQVANKMRGLQLQSALQG